MDQLDRSADPSMFEAPAPGQNDRPAAPVAQPTDGSAPETSPGLVGRKPLSRPPRRWRAGLVLASLVLVLVAVLGVRYWVPRPVETWQVAAGSLTTERAGPGTLDATRRASLSPKIQARIVSVAVDRNDQVKAGDEIARLASDDLESELAAAVASQKASEQAVDQARAESQRKQAALADARQKFEQQAKLLKSKTTTQSSYDTAQSTLRQAEADQSAAEASIAQAEAQAQSAEANVAVARTNVSEATIRAPFNGIVIARDQNPGDLASPGSPIIEIADPRSVVLTARFDESAIASIEPGQVAILHFGSQSDRPISGHVLRLSREVDTETREFTADIVPDELPKNWAIGQRGTATVTTGTRTDVLAVPTRFITRRDGAPGVWVARHDRAQWQPVDLGALGEERVEIRAGLRAGDMLIHGSRIFEKMRLRPARGTTP
ncbi:efflux RND transporter periplasmic adaptor subunit [Consotaella salsifontis]|nr:efflux RND transporter periplasmic adaptor subunit [Consotaella salsifontis]